MRDTDLTNAGGQNLRCQLHFFSDCAHFVRRSRRYSALTPSAIAPVMPASSPSPGVTI